MLAASGADGIIKVWDADEWMETVTIKRQAKQAKVINGVAFSQDGHRLASGGGDGTVELFDPHTGKELLTLIRENSSVYCVAFTPDGKHLAFGREDGTVKICNPSTGETINQNTPVKLS